MKTAIILHGMPEEKSYFDPGADAQSNAHWIPWIQQQLLVEGVLAQAPELPHPYRPIYEDWKTVFERFDVDEETFLIGHSCGAGFLVRWLSEHKIKAGKVVLVAPWLDPHGELADFFKFDIDPEVPERAKSIDVFISEDDDEEIRMAVETIAATWPSVETHRMNGKGHFTQEDMGTREFPELKRVLLG